eukprot:762539-Hanusia_phi.AAC.5
MEMLKVSPKELMPPFQFVEYGSEKLDDAQSWDWMQTMYQETKQCGDDIKSVLRDFNERLLFTSRFTTERQSLASITATCLKQYKVSAMQNKTAVWTLQIIFLRLLQRFLGNQNVLADDKIRDRLVQLLEETHTGCPAVLENDVGECILCESSSCLHSGKIPLWSLTNFKQVASSSTHGLWFIKMTKDVMQNKSMDLEEVEAQIEWYHKHLAVILVKRCRNGLLEWFKDSSHGSARHLLFHLLLMNFPRKKYMQHCVSSLLELISMENLDRHENLCNGSLLNHLLLCVLYESALTWKDHHYFSAYPLVILDRTRENRVDMMQWNIQNTR